MVSDREFNSEFGKRFKGYREAKGLKQAEMARQLKSSGVYFYPSTINKIETGVRPLKGRELLAVAELFGITVEALLGRAMRPRHAQARALQAIADTTLKASGHASLDAMALTEHVDQLAEFKGVPDRGALIDGCERAHGLLLEAVTVLDETAQIARRNMSQLLKGN